MRPVCQSCLRPLKTCICKWVEQVYCDTEIGILQHPLEVGQAKGTARLAHLCLPNSQLWVGEDLAELPDLQTWLASKTTCLLYPSESPGLVSSSLVEDRELNLNASDLECSQVLVLDGTWRKTFKTLQLNPILQALPRVRLSGELQTEYSIRKTKRANSLSTFEAIRYVLQQRHPEQDFSALQSAFSNFIVHQQSFLPVNKASES